MSMSTECGAAGHLATSIWTSRIIHDDVVSLLSTLSVYVVLIGFYSFNFNNIGAQNNLKFVNSAEFENQGNKWAMSLYFIGTDYQATIEAARDRIDDEKCETIEWWAVELIIIIT